MVNKLLILFLSLILGLGLGFYTNKNVIPFAKSLKDEYSYEIFKDVCFQGAESLTSKDFVNCFPRFHEDLISKVENFSQLNLVISHTAMNNFRFKQSLAQTDLDKEKMVVFSSYILIATQYHYIKKAEDLLRESPPYDLIDRYFLKKTIKTGGVRIFNLFGETKTFCRFKEYFPCVHLLKFDYNNFRPAY